jgi:hypothetical protein
VCRQVVLVLLALTPALACSNGNGSAYNGSPTDPRCSELTALSISCTPQGDALQCHASANYYCGPGPDVTAQAQWRSSDSSVVTISADGVAHASSPGDAQISAIYLGTSGFERVRVLSGQPPLPLFEIGSRVVASPTCGPNDGVPGVIVTVASGLNVGRSATTGNGGSYTIPDVVYGAISLHASRDGYQDAIVTGAVGYSPGIPTICITPVPK